MLCINSDELTTIYEYRLQEWCKETLQLAVGYIVNLSLIRLYY